MTFTTTPDAATASQSGMLTPEQWRDQLLEALAAKQTGIQRCDAYYQGQHKMAFTTAQFRETFGNLFSTFADNWCDLVVDASAERLKIEGFRFGDQSADQDAWTIWQRNGLDAEADMAHTEAIKLSCAYILVGPDDGGLATIQVEPPSQAIVCLDPAQGRRRLAGLRSWSDEWGTDHCVVYLPDQVVWWSKDGDQGKWEEDIGTGSNPLGIVPLIPLANAPTLSNRLGRSDIERVIPIQNAINKICGDLIVASEFAAYPQRWATGIEIPQNPETGERMAAQFLGGADRVWGVEATDARFGNFAVSDLGIYVKAVEMLIQHLSAQTRTPPHYLLGAMGTFPSGESLKATETGLVAKVQRKMLSFGESWEEAMRLAFAIENDSARAEMIDVETIWKNPESRIVGETVDAATKLASIGVPRPALWEYIGASPQQIERWMVDGEPKGPSVPEKETIAVAATPQQAQQIEAGDTVTPAPAVPVPAAKPSPAAPPITGGKTNAG